MLVTKLLSTGIVALAASAMTIGLAQGGPDDDQPGQQQPRRMGPPPSEQLFNMIDTDDDGVISKQEFAQHRPPEGFGPPDGVPPRGGRGMGQGRGQRGGFGRGGFDGRQGPPMGPPRDQQGDRPPRGPRGGEFTGPPRGDACPYCQGSGMAPRDRGTRGRDFGGPRDRGPRDQGSRFDDQGDFGPPPPRFNNDRQGPPPQGRRGEGRRWGRPELEQPPAKDQTEGKAPADGLDPET